MAQIRSILASVMLQWLTLNSALASYQKLNGASRIFKSSTKLLQSPTLNSAFTTFQNLNGASSTFKSCIKFDLFSIFLPKPQISTLLEFVVTRYNQQNSCKHVLRPEFHYISHGKAGWVGMGNGSEGHNTKTINARLILIAEMVMACEYYPIK